MLSAYFSLVKVTSELVTFAVSLTIVFLHSSLLRVPSAYLSLVKVTSELITLAVSLTVGFLRPSLLKVPSDYLSLAINRGY